jgi:hypothetical protein
MIQAYSRVNAFFLFFILLDTNLIPKVSTQFFEIIKNFSVNPDFHIFSVKGNFNKKDAWVLVAFRKQ